MIKNAYIRGFVRKCRECGISPSNLIKLAQSVAVVAPGAEEFLDATDNDPRYDQVNDDEWRRRRAIELRKQKALGYGPGSRGATVPPKTYTGPKPPPLHIPQETGTYGTGVKPPVGSTPTPPAKPPAPKPPAKPPAPKPPAVNNSGKTFESKVLISPDAEEFL